ncbi:hypothetical protein MLD38_021516 [Melastoma candidum]|uniref:Uncharacterized protein n=1 Tax=Melastoma candidum TaxID=119954 RepID=A0ACB9QK72_9MYRT|nr:hypothetical protein MLD38_021516 [Melastoma candidum]
MSSGARVLDCHPLSLQAAQRDGGSVGRHVLVQIELRLGKLNRTGGTACGCFHGGLHVGRLSPMGHRWTVVDCDCRPRDVRALYLDPNCRDAISLFGMLSPGLCCEKCALCFARDDLGLRGEGSYHFCSSSPGDSLQREQWQSFECMIQQMIPAHGIQL